VTTPEQPWLAAATGPPHTLRLYAARAWLALRLTFAGWVYVKEAARDHA
jgi:hypothetical protein